MRSLILALLLTAPAHAQDTRTTSLEDEREVVDTLRPERDTCATDTRLTAAALDQIAFFLRLRQRPDLLESEWTELIDESIEILVENPLYVEDTQNPLWQLGEAAVHTGELELGRLRTDRGERLQISLHLGLGGGQVFTGNGPIFTRSNVEG